MDQATQPMMPEAAAGELPDDQYEDAIDRVMAAFMQAISAPEMRDTLLQAVGSADTMATLVYETLSALDEKSGATIPEEVLPAVAFEAVGALAEVAEAAGAGGDPGALAAQATQLVLMRFLTEAGVDPQQVQQIMQSVDPRQAAGPRAGVVGGAMAGGKGADDKDE
jgi:hypothetical protein